MAHALNFSSRDEMIPNIAELTGLDTADIDAFIKELRDLAKGEAAHRTYWDTFQKRFGIVPDIAETVVFHGTRCPTNTSFSQGLLPNADAMKILWQQIWQICSEHLDARCAEDLQAHYENTEDSRRGGGYFDRITGDRNRERGPWGKLIRDEWLIYGRNGNHYFDRGPEIVQIILNYYSKSIDLKKLFQERTKPCIVHFRTNRFDPYDIGHALAFLRDQRFCQYDYEYQIYYGNYSSEGRAISRDRILKIEFVEPPHADQSLTRRESKGET